ncbi:hypothetical protein IAQ61_011772 [Plenodomus lingam]|uniref:uncharacterized protein n=1 Tax=Leptosphaeria maculans TaxID=5022 RepID=UPI00332F0D06|nr:hypothetical protein IAQ61_011772 [Plenodomus lingam]
MHNFPLYHHHDEDAPLLDISAQSSTTFPLRQPTNLITAPNWKPGFANPNEISSTYPVYHRHATFLDISAQSKITPEPRQLFD